MARIESSVTAISWIPSDAIEGLTKEPFELGLFHYDDPPPDVLDDLERLRAADAFRIANELRAWIEVEDGRIVGYGHAGKAPIGATRLRIGSKDAIFPGVAFPLLRPDPTVDETSVRFVQAAGGRTALPAPRRVARKPFFQIVSSAAWTTLALTIRTDGSSEHALVGASPFPRHWIYDGRGVLTEKSGLINFNTWYRGAFGKQTPWGDTDSPALVSPAETALERVLSRRLMNSRPKPEIQELAPGTPLVEQGDPGTELFVLLDGVLAVEVDGQKMGEVGPGAILGERALLKGGTRTATLRAVTRCKVAVGSADQVSVRELTEVGTGHRREDQMDED